jgi:hypothetical protein
LTTGTEYLLNHSLHCSIQKVVPSEANTYPIGDKNPTSEKSLFKRRGHCILLF